jgi:GH25 family lysozyme M1 (1,4-beta-N-acetylmuramidase)
VNRPTIVLQRLLAAAAAALLAMPLLVGSVAAASSPYVANCDTRLRGTPSTDAATVAVIPSGTAVTATGTVTGGAWSADCGAGVVSASSWYVITAVDGTSTTSLYGAASVYAATGLFSPVIAPPPAGYLEGVDVSRWQGTVDYAQVRASGRRFVVAKATEGYGYLDSKWATTRAAVQAAGLRLGAYHFARPDLNPTPEEAAAEADWFVSQMNIAPGMLVPALDLEVHGTLGVTALTNWVKAWLAEVYAKTGTRAMIYTSPSFWRTAVGDSRWFADNGYTVLWVAHWTSNSAPSVPASNWGGRSWTFWQYADNGVVPGIGGTVDLDRYNGTDLTKVTFGADFNVSIGAPAGAKQGRATSVAVNLQRTWFTAPVSLSVSGLPGSVSAALSATSTTGAGATLTFTTTGATPVGTYPFTVTASALGTTRTAQGTLTVSDGIAPGSTIHPSLFAGGTIGSTVPIRTTWGASDASGIAAFGAVRKTNTGSWIGQTLAAKASTSLTQSLAVGTSYRYGVRATDGASNTGAYAYGAAFKAIRTQQYSSTVHYSTGWTGLYVTSASGGSLRYATRAGAWVSYTFSGRSIGWVAYRGPTRGKADVYVDGAYRSTVDLYSATSTARPIVFVANWSAVGTHTVRIVVKGTAGHPRVDVDAFVRLTSG